MSTELICYKIGKVTFIILLIGIGVVYILGSEQIIEMFPSCSFFTATGIYCPGCGGTRSVLYLLQGNIVRSFLYHPFVIYFTITYIVFMIYEFCKKHFPICKKSFPIEIVLYTGVGVLLLQWVVKVILQFTL